jgi:tetratricopeptide (TPR) repeat protein
MKRYVPLILLLLAAVYFTSTGFQCGSAEATSAKLYFSQKNYVKAEESLLKEIAKNDKNEEAWFLLGQVRYEMKKYEGMDEAFTRTLQLSDLHRGDIMRYRLGVWGTTVNEGIAYFNKGKDSSDYYRKSLENFHFASRLMPDSLIGAELASRSYSALGKNDSAIVELEPVVKAKPNGKESVLLLRDLYYITAANKTTPNPEVYYGKAARVLEAAHNGDPANLEYVLGLVDAYEKLKQTDKAMKLTSEAVKTDPTNKKYRYIYGIFLLNQEQFSAAIDQFTEAVKLDPDYEDANYNLGVGYLNWGIMQKQEADKKYEAERKTNKNAKEDLSYKEKFKAGLPYVEKVITKKEDDPNLWRALAQIYSTLGMTDKAKMALDKFTRLTK